MPRVPRVGFRWGAAVDVFGDPIVLFEEMGEMYQAATGNNPDTVAAWEMAEADAEVDSRSANCRSAASAIHLPSEAFTRLNSSASTTIKAMRSP